MTTPAEHFRQAEARVRAGDGRIDVSLRSPLADLLAALGDLAVAYPEMAHDHDRPACDDYACDVMGRAITLARHLTRQENRR